MFTLVDPKAMWPQMQQSQMQHVSMTSQMTQMSHVPQYPFSPLSANQIYMAPVATTPTYLIGGTPHVMPTPNQIPAMFYGLPPSWCSQPYVTPMTSLPFRQSRVPSDEVFIVDNTKLIKKPENLNTAPRGSKKPHAKRRQRIAATTEDDAMSVDSDPPSERQLQGKHLEGNDSTGGVFAHSSPRSDGCSSSGCGSSCGGGGQSRSSHPEDNSLDHNLNRSIASSEIQKHTTDINFENSLFNIFTTSLYSALNRDPPEPTCTRTGNSSVVPLKTSSPIEEKKFQQNCINALDSANGNEIEKYHIATKKALAGTELENDSCSANDPMSCENSNDEQSGTRRQKFLRALEEERERQRCLVLPKHTPKMNCKFCKNNGEAVEVYTKHRLHFKEKTACPLLRLYVCRLCNSTGDFAHTIRHCPFNSRADKIAWKATFL